VYVYFCGWLDIADTAYAIDCNVKTLVYYTRTKTYEYLKKLTI